MYQIIGCHVIEHHDLGIRPRSEVLTTKTDPPWLTAWVGEVLLLGRAMIVGVRQPALVSCRLRLERIQQSVTWGGEHSQRRRPEIKGFHGIQVSGAATLGRRR